MYERQARRFCWLWLLGWVLAPGILPAKGITVRGQITLAPLNKKGRAGGNPRAVVWLTPLKKATSSPDIQNKPSAGRFRLVQKNKRFTPHILVIPAGSTVEFPNDDPFFHNVFSLFHGKRFDLGLYEAGTSRTVRFSEPGICYIFCNIHPEMSAVIFVMKTGYYAISSRAGQILITGVPPGRYRLNIWDEHCLPDALRAVSRDVIISPSASSLGNIRLPQSGDLLSKHKNLYGRDYDPGASAYPNYNPQ